MVLIKGQGEVHGVGGVQVVKFVEQALLQLLEPVTCQKVCQQLLLPTRNSHFRVMAGS